MPSIQRTSKTVKQTIEQTPENVVQTLDKDCTMHVFNAPKSGVSIDVDAVNDLKTPDFASKKQHPTKADKQPQNGSLGIDRKISFPTDKQTVNGKSYPTKADVQTVKRPSKNVQKKALENGAKADKQTTNKLYSIAGRFFLQSIARNILLGVMDRKGKQFRIVSCCRAVIPNSHFAEIWRDNARKAAYLRKLERCLSVHVCPVCAARISEVRRAELSKAVEQSGLNVIMVTFTLAHTIRDSLQTTLDALMYAIDRIISGKFRQRFWERWNVVGTIRALEVTYSDENGYHPHAHMLLFLRNPLSRSIVNRSARRMIAPRRMIRRTNIDANQTPSLNRLRAPNRLNRRSRKMIRRTSKNQLADIQRELSVQWRRGLKKLGRSAGRDVGVVVTDSDREKAEYIAKFGREPEKVWDAAREVTKGQSKKGREKGLTMWQVLALIGDESLTATKRAHYTRIFREYALVTKGRQQLTWSSGLKDMIGLKDVSDDEILIQDEFNESLAIFAALTRSQWSIVLKNDARAELIELCATGDIDRVGRFLASLGAIHEYQIDQRTYDLKPNVRNLVGETILYFPTGKDDQPVEYRIAPSEDRSADND